MIFLWYISSFIYYLNIKYLIIGWFHLFTQHCCACLTKHLPRTAAWLFHFILLLSARRYQGSNHYKMWIYSTIFNRKTNSNKKNLEKSMVTALKTNIFSEKWWLEDDPFPFWNGPFSGDMLIVGGVTVRPWEVRLWTHLTEIPFM